MPGTVFEHKAVWNNERADAELKRVFSSFNQRTSWLSDIYWTRHGRYGIAILGGRRRLTIRAASSNEKYALLKAAYPNDVIVVVHAGDPPSDIRWKTLQQLQKER